MYSHQSIDFSFLSFQSDSYKFYQDIVKIKTLLYLSMHQSPEYILWLDNIATANSKSFLKSVSKQILEEILIDFETVSSKGDILFYKKKDAFLYHYELKSFSLHQPLSTIKTCDSELSRLHDESIKIELSLVDCKSAHDKVGMESIAYLENNISTMLRGIKKTLGSGYSWETKIDKINLCISDINELLDINYQSVENHKINEIVNTIHHLTKQIRAYITNMFRAYIDVFNFGQINTWCGLIDKMTLDDSKEAKELIKQDLKFLVNSTNLDSIISNNVHGLSAINNELLLFMKGMDENKYSTDFSQMKDCMILKNMGITFENTNKLSASNFFKLGSVTLQSDRVVPHPLLACEFFELAFMYAEDKDFKLLSLCQLEAAYNIAVSGSYFMGFYDETHIALYRYLKFIKSLDKSPEIVLAEMECQVVKFKVDVAKNNIHKDRTNVNLLNILFLLEQNNFTSTPDFKVYLEKKLCPIHVIRYMEELGDSNAEIMDKICKMVTEDYHSANTRTCSIQ